MADTQYEKSNNLESRINLHRLYGKSTESWFTWVFSQMAFPKGSSVLEIGCGTAQLWTDNRDRLPPDLKVTLTDKSPGMLDEARRAMGGTPGFSFQLTDAEELPFDSASMDVVIANHMLYHVPHVEKAMVEIRRVLKPGGGFYATTNGTGHMARVADILERTDGRIDFRKVTTPSFSLQDGPATLSRFFTRVELRTRSDGGSLEVTSADDFITYVLSMEGVSNAAAILKGGKLETLREALVREIRERGHIKIHTETGMLIARKAV